MNLELFLQNLTEEQKSHLFLLLSTESMNEHSRFNNGRYCPKCHFIHPVKRGVIKNHQRYFCPKCNKYFTVYTNTILNYTKKDILIWKQYIKMMFEPKPRTNKEISSILNISYMTAFRWRRKILKILEEKFMNDNLGGIVEADETFILVSHKGRHIDGTYGRRRGGSSKYRGLSHQQAGILVAIDRNKNLISKVYGFGKISGAQVVSVLSKRIDKNSLLITDGCNAYSEFAYYEGLQLKQLKAGRAIGSGIHLNTVNSYHSRLKRWLCNFNGISTKYLNEYLAWFKFLQQKNDCGFLFNELILE